MNWGYKITIIISAFVVGMLMMVYIAMQQTNEMMDERYYEKEKTFQSKLEAKNRLFAVYPESLISQNDTQIVILIPEFACGKIKEVKITFLKIDNQALDKVFMTEPASSCFLTFEKNEFVDGFYKINIEWEFEDELYISESEFYINK
jgi:hypothetical protein